MRDIRKCAGVQVTQIAREYGISQGYLTEVELEQKDASMRVLLIYSKKFSIPISDIFIKVRNKLLLIMRSYKMTLTSKKVFEMLRQVL